MKPIPFSPLNHFTTPCVMRPPSYLNPSGGKSAPALECRSSLAGACRAEPTTPLSRPGNAGKPGDDPAAGDRGLHPTTTTSPHPPAPGARTQTSVSPPGHGMVAPPAQATVDPACPEAAPHPGREIGRTPTSGCAKRPLTTVADNDTLQSLRGHRGQHEITGGVEEVGRHRQPR